jgi:hypothetical protein
MTDAPFEARQLVGLFEDQSTFEAAINDLQAGGIDRSQLSILSHRSFEEHDPHTEEEAAEAALDPESQGTAVTSDVDLRQGRTMLSGMAGAVGGSVTGAAILLTGAAAAAALPLAAAAGLGFGAAAHAAGRKASQTETRHLREQLEHGGIVLWVTPRTRHEEEAAMDILDRRAVRSIAVDRSNHDADSRSGSEAAGEQP